MPSDKCNSITAKATDLIFSLFNIASAGCMPFGIPQYVQYILHGLTSFLLCVPFILVCDGFWKLSIFSFDCSGAFQTVLDS